MNTFMIVSTAFYAVVISTMMLLHQTANAFTAKTTTAAIATSCSSSTVTADTIKNPRPVIPSDYKEKLMAAGLLELQSQRPIQILAMNIGTNAENYMQFTTSSSTDNADHDKSSSSIITTKIIHFQRHGQGYHNLLGDVYRSHGNSINIDDPNPKTNPFVKPEIQDSPLTFQGRQEAMQRRIQASMLSPQLIIVSPLHRAIQTAMLSFTDHINTATTTTTKKPIPFIAHEGCREQLGLLTCNKALPLSQTKIDFPLVDFSLITHGEEDTLWNQHPLHREHPVQEANRAYNFLTNFVMKREEAEMAIVCHSAWLFSVCNAVMDCGGDEFLESWFETGEIRSLKVTFMSNSE